MERYVLERRDSLQPIGMSLLHADAIGGGTTPLTRASNLTSRDPAVTFDVPRHTFLNVSVYAAPSSCPTVAKAKRGHTQVGTGGCHPACEALAKVIACKIVNHTPNTERKRITHSLSQRSHPTPVYNVPPQIACGKCRLKFFRYWMMSNLARQRGIGRDLPFSVAGGVHGERRRGIPSAE